MVSKELHCPDHLQMFSLLHIWGRLEDLYCHQLLGILSLVEVEKVVGHGSKIMPLYEVAFMVYPRGLPLASLSGKKCMLSPHNCNGPACTPSWWKGGRSQQDQTGKKNDALHTRHLQPRSVYPETGGVVWGRASLFWLLLHNKSCRFGSFLKVTSKDDLGIRISDKLS